MELGQWFYLQGGCQNEWAINSSESFVSIKTFSVMRILLLSRSHTETKNLYSETVGGWIMSLGLIDFWIITKTYRLWQNNSSHTLVHPILTTIRNKIVLYKTPAGLIFSSFVIHCEIKVKYVITTCFMQKWNFDCQNCNNFNSTKLCSWNSVKIVFRESKPSAQKTIWIHPKIYCRVNSFYDLTLDV